MELRDIYRIFEERKNIFLIVFFSCVFVALLTFRFQPGRFETNLTVNVSRSGTQATSDYTYDQFYRLQADERFADTVVRWLAAPSIQDDIRTASGVSSDVAGSITAKRLSSQMIDVTYISRTKDGFGGMSHAVPEILNKETEKLNILAKSPDWFVVMADDPAVRDARLPMRIVLPLGVALGAFLGFWAVLSYWYLGGGRESDEIGNDA